ncbi:hypothetical protein AAW14_00840 [Streptomyces hygroscopicus]|nr:hypothetical protein [Streptomyces hygroscopicus]
MNFPAADAELVSAARQGAQGALEELAGRYLPLVYNIVGRALPGPSDVDDVVQETMLGVVRGLSGLCDGSAFRPWLVAVTMSQIRTHRESYPAPPRVLEELAVVADPGADFVDLTLNRLQLSGQRREAAEATRWLDADDRELLSLWWLVTAGHLTQAEMVAAIGLDAHHVTLRVSRMKSQLEIARVVARALAVTPRCSDLERTIHLWDGRPGGLWRKRLARHVRGCGSCGGPSAGLVPLEGLLANLALVPLPLGYTAFVLSGIGYETTSAATEAGHTGPVSHRRTRRNSRHRNGRSLGSFTGNPMVVAAAFTATLTAAVGIGALTSGPGGEKPMAGRQPGLSAPDDAGSTEPHTTTPAPATTTAPTPTPAATTPHEPTAAPSRTRHTPASIPRTTVPGHRADSAVAGSEAAAAAEVLSVINQARAAHNMAPLETSTGLESSSGAHNRTMATGCGLQHECPGEAQLGDRETVAGVRWGAAGENIGTDGSLAHTTADLASRAVGLTKSMLAEQPPNDGHRRNILNPDFHHIGINVLHGSSGNLWLTQDFAD